MRAVYRDSEGHTYSAPLELRDDQWLMRTSDGLLQPIEYTFKDAKAGRLIFSHYREEDVARRQPDTRLHVEPGQDSFARLQHAGAIATAHYETQRERERQAMLQSLNEPNARKIAEARAHATAMAQRWNQKRPEPIPPSQLTQEQIQELIPMAEEHRWHRPKKEQ